MNAIQSFENRIWQKRAVQRAVESTYIIWSKSDSTWQHAFFDKSFVQGEAMPVLSRFIDGEVDGEPSVGVTDLVQSWMAQFSPNPQRRQQLSAELAPVARDFLRILEGEFEYQRSRRQRSIWYKLWHGAGSVAGQPAPYA